MKKILLTILLFLSFKTIQSQKLPKDALDTNVALVFDPDASVDDNEETLAFFTESIIENGFNLVGKYLYTDSQISKKEIEFDLKNKNVKYLFLLTYKYYKGPDYDLYFFENDKNINPDFIKPKKKILKLKPSFIKFSYDFEGIIIRKLEKKVNKLKTNFEKINSIEYDPNLINTLLLSKKNILELNELNNKSTLIDGVTLQINNNNIPSDLKSEKLAIIGTSKKEYRNYKSLNSILKSKFKKYPYYYEFFKDYKNYLSKGGDEKFKYRLQLTKSNQSMLSLSKSKYTLTESYRVNKGNNTISSSFHTTPINYQKTLFSLIIKDNNTNERYIVTKRGYIKKTIKNFIKTLK